MNGKLFLSCKYSRNLVAPGLRASRVRLLKSTAMAMESFYEIRMLLRLTPMYGGDGTECGIIALNDTGSDVLSLFDTDLPFLGVWIQGYLGWQGLVGIEEREWWNFCLSKNSGTSSAREG